jgi:hypothetical protein
MITVSTVRVEPEKDEDIIYVRFLCEADATGAARMVVPLARFRVSADRHYPGTGTRPPYEAGG